MDRLIENKYHFKAFLMNLVVIFFVFGGIAGANSSGTSDTPFLIFIDDNGIIRYTETGTEASFFGVNYSPPFAHSYRAMKLLGLDHKAEMDKDIYHFARLGMNAFRIHVWDTEISDHEGNLLHNEHLDLFDYMLYKLEERGIKVILTPFTFYDNAYPDGATNTPGFANFISKYEAPRNPEFMPILKNYLEQFLTHVNPYTGKSYLEDPNIILTEIINEPVHSGEMDDVRLFVNELADHIRGFGWEKPVFYNISESPAYAEAVMNAEIDGVSFQWYPGGLVSGKETRKNYLPYIQEYSIPFGDMEPMKNKAKMVYEFDSADLMYSYAYPVMAKSFREAGFQWATQFAYDPLGFSFANSDYPTHYLNMIYTPSKAISMRIAGEVFRRYPLNAEPVSFPKNKEFNEFRVSHSEDLALMNSDEMFFYTNSTSTNPVSSESLKKIAGVGNSPVIHYSGTGAYFLDQLEPGIWRLEVMPDVIAVRNPFERPAFDKHVSVIEWHEREMSIQLPDLGKSFSISGLNEGNSSLLKTETGSFIIKPGAYLVVKKDFDHSNWNAESMFETIKIGEYAAIEQTSTEIVVRHEPFTSVDANPDLSIRATVAGLKPGDNVRLMGYSFDWISIDADMHEVAPFTYEAIIPSDKLNAGLIQYWISVERGGKLTTFPGSNLGSPHAWNYYHDDKWVLNVTNPDSPVVLFDAKSDYGKIVFGFRTWQNTRYLRGMTTTDTPNGMSVWVKTDNLEPIDYQALGWTTYVGDNLNGRETTLTNATSLSIRGKSVTHQDVDITVIIVCSDGTSFTSTLSLSGSNTVHEIQLDSFKRGAHMLLPRPYPGFMPFWFQSEAETTLTPTMIEEIQFLIGDEQVANTSSHEIGFEIESVWIK